MLSEHSGCFPRGPNLIRLAVIRWIQFLNYSILHPLVICDKGGLRQASVGVRMLSVCSLRSRSTARTASQARVAETVELPLNAFKKKSKEEVRLKDVCLKNAVRCITSSPSSADISSRGLWFDRNSRPVFRDVFNASSGEPRQIYQPRQAS